MHISVGSQRLPILTWDHEKRPHRAEVKSKFHFSHDFTAHNSADRANLPYLVGWGGLGEQPGILLRPPVIGERRAFNPSMLSNLHNTSGDAVYVQKRRNPPGVGTHRGMSP